LNLDFEQIKSEGKTLGTHTPIHPGPDEEDTPDFSAPDHPSKKRNALSQSIQINMQAGVGG
jgi:hypothetical protein